MIIDLLLYCLNSGDAYILTTIFNCGIDSSYDLYNINSTRFVNAFQESHSQFYKLARCHVGKLYIAMGSNECCFEMGETL